MRDFCVNEPRKVHSKTKNTVPNRNVPLVTFARTSAESWEAASPAGRPKPRRFVRNVTPLIGRVTLKTKWCEVCLSFSTLLPEGHMRDYLAKRAGVKAVREFHLLWTLGAGSSLAGRNDSNVCG